MNYEGLLAFIKKKTNNIEYIYVILESCFVRKLRPSAVRLRKVKHSKERPWLKDTQAKATQILQKYLLLLTFKYPISAIKQNSGGYYPAGILLYSCLTVV